MLDSITAYITQNLNPWLACFVISILPILELRGGLIAASVLGLAWVPATVVCVLGNWLPVPFILLFIRKILSWMGTTKLFGKIARHYEERALRKGAELTEKYPRRIMLAIFLFVAIPLPGTGAWTGALVSAFLGVPIKKCLPMILLGVLGAAVIMLLLAYAFPTLMGFKV